MIIETRENTGVVILDVKGDIMADNRNILKEEFNKLMDAGTYNIIINFKEVYVIDSSGIGLLVSTLQKLREKKGDLKIVHLSGFSKRTFNVTGLNTIFHIMKNEEAAVESFNVTDNF